MENKVGAKEIVTLKNVSKTYKVGNEEIIVLDDVNLSILEGDYLSIVGPSGCGKSTLLSILGLLDIPTSGRYMLDGIETKSLSLAQKSDVRNIHIGFIFQAFNLIDNQSVFENVALPLRYREPRLSEAEIKERVEVSIAEVNLTDKINYRPNQLSGGQQQRVAIARAIVGKPDILLVDEPTGNLDSKNSDNVMRLLTELNSQGHTICIVSHDNRYESLASHRCHLLDGKLISESKEKAIAG